MLLDVRTLGILSAFMPFVLGIIMSIYWRERRTYEGFGRWVLANFVFGVGYIQISLRGILPDFFSIVLGNAATIYAEILIYEGIRLFYGRPAFSKWNSFVFVLYLVLHTYFTYLNPNINIRIAIISLTLFILIWRSGLSLINSPLLELRRTTRTAGIVFLLTALLPLARSFHALLQNQPIDLFADPMSSWFALFGLVSILIWTFYFFLINSARLEMDLEAARVELTQLAMTDPLTGLYNRRHFFERAEIEFQRATRQEHSISFLLMDVDGFKNINDNYGHDAGDAILQKLSSTMKGAITENEFIIRFGGEEFLIIMKNPTPESADELANRINQEFAKLVFTFNNNSFSKTVSIGYAFFPSDTDQIWKCIKFADLCLYKAKETGRNKVIRFTKELLKGSDKDNY